LSGNPESGLALDAVAAPGHELPVAPAGLSRREHDHIGNTRLIHVADSLLEGTGIHLDKAYDRGSGILTVDVLIEPAEAAKATPWKHHDIQGVVVDLVSDRNGEPWAALCSDSPHGRLDFAFVIRSLPADGLPILYEGQTYRLTLTADGGAELAGSP
jgi:hypothetical protein